MSADSTAPYLCRGLLRRITRMSPARPPEGAAAATCSAQTTTLSRPPWPAYAERFSRPDLPKWTEVSKLAAGGRIHYLAYPFMAGLQELSAAPEASNCRLGDSQARLAVAIHFAVPRMRERDHSKRPPGWLRNCLAHDPDMVAEVWSRCARAQLGRGERYLPDTHRLVHEREYAQLAQAASVPLLKAFPVRCGTGQLPILRCPARGLRWGTETGHNSSS